MAVLAAFAVPHPPLIIPVVGRGEERGIQATVDAYDEVGRRIAELAPETVVVSSPHSIMYRDYIHVSPGAGASGSFAQFRAPEARYEVTYDTELVERLCALCIDEGLDAGCEGERDPSLDHGTMIPLHFIQKFMPLEAVKVVRIGISGLSPAEHYRLGALVQRAAADLGRRVVYVASGDLSHKLLAEGPYGFAPEGPVFDELTCDAFASGDLLALLTADPGLCERAAECGLRSFQIMAGALDGTPIRAELLSHEGPFGVGYAVAAFTPEGDEGTDGARRLLPRYLAWRRGDLDDRRAHEDLFVRLARASLESWVRDGKRVRPTPALLDRLASEAVADGMTPEDATIQADELASAQAGAFVSLKIDGQLRGCIGTIAPTCGSVAEEVCQNAVSACAHDPRFLPVRKDELDSLVYDVDVLGEAEEVAGTDGLDVRRYGVIVSCADGRRGLLLPDLDGVDTVDEQVSIAAHKGGIDLASDDYRLERFEVIRHL